MQQVEEASRRWVAAGIIDEDTAARIRAFERDDQRKSGLRWPALVAWIFGAILLAAGICLFVAAHWDKLSPGLRFITLLVILALLHGGAMRARDRYNALAMALHGAGTIAAGAAVFLCGQIFNLQEHWPGSILLWALCALAGWALLRDQVQETLTWLLFPAWLVCEWSFRAQGFRDSSVMTSRMSFVLAAFLLTAFLNSRKKLVAGVMFAVGVIGILITTAILAGDEGWNWSREAMSPWSLRFFGWLLIVLLPVILALWQQRRAAIFVLAAALVATVLPHLHHPDPLYERGPSIAAFAVMALFTAFITWWGVRETSQRLLNFGVVGFGLVVLWFYGSSVMDKLDRSLSLIGLGVLFVFGGMLLEKMRRRLVSQIVPKEPA